MVEAGVSCHGSSAGRMEPDDGIRLHDLSLQMEMTARIWDPSRRHLFLCLPVAPALDLLVLLPEQHLQANVLHAILLPELTQHYQKKRKPFPATNGVNSQIAQFYHAISLQCKITKTNMILSHSSVLK